MDCTPVWLMRQAGRYLEEYRRLREGRTFLELAKTPELAAEVTLQPLRRFPLDAAILFADILLPLEPMGCALSIEEGLGPRIERPLRTRADVMRLRPVEPRDLAYVFEAMGMVRRELEGKVPVIGFAGAPFTLASYAVEGGPSRDFRRLKELMWTLPDVFDDLMTRLADVTVMYLKEQVRSGAQALQIFDSWVGALAPEDYRRSVLPHTRRVIREVSASGVPLIHFAPLTGGYLDLVAEAGGDVLSVDWRTRIGDVRRRFGSSFGVQGNMDPTLLAAGPPERIRLEAVRIVEDAGPDPGFVFNLGHGILKDTPPSHVACLVDAVHSASSRHPKEAPL